MHFTNNGISRLLSKVAQVELTPTSLKLNDKDAALEYVWSDMFCPPQCEASLSSTQIQVFDAQGDVAKEFKFRAYPELVSQLQEYWCVANAQQLASTVAKIEGLLKSRFLSAQLWEIVQNTVAQLTPRWLSWELKDELPMPLRQSYYTLQELANWTSQDLEEFKNAFISKQLNEHESFFNTVTGQPLTLAQRKACVIQDNRQLLLAGAGTGKTSVMVAKAKFLQHTKQAEPHQILMLAYGKEASKELQERGDKLGNFPEVLTFHALGKKIIGAVEQSRPQVSELATNEQARQNFIRDTLKALAHDHHYHMLLVRFIEQNITQAKVKDLSEYLQSTASNRLLSTLSSLIGFYKCANALNEVGAIESRFADELECLKPLLAEYQLYLQNEQAIDFEDMIIKAIVYIKLGRYKVNWKYLLVDEFQDISPIRAKLINTLLKAEQQSCLFAVGDDWQSIYRFSGADISFTTEFAKHFGECTVTQLDQTFRYPQSILDLSSHFVCANPNQIMKGISSSNKSSTLAIDVVNQQEPEQALFEALERIANQSALSPSVLILARTHQGLLERGAMQSLKARFSRLDIKSMTFHASKGKEADYVILMGLDQSAQGVPSRAKTPAILNALLPAAERFPDAEERRLFYVALTRARKQLLLLKPDIDPSPFLEELQL